MEKIVILAPLFAMKIVIGDCGGIHGGRWRIKKKCGTACG